MTVVFQRAVSVRAGAPGEPGIEFGTPDADPLTPGHHIDFSTRASDGSTPGECRLTIWNPSDKSQEAFSDSKHLATLSVGHRNRGMGVIFQGNPDPDSIRLEKRGGDLAFKVTLADGGRSYAYDRLDVSFSSATSGDQVIEAVLANSGLGRGQIDLGNVRYPRQYVHRGMARDALNELVRKAALSDGVPRRWFVRDGNLYILPNGTPTKEEAIVYSADNGTLVGSPTGVEKGGIEFQGLIVDTSLRVGRIVRVESRTYTGFYKAVSVEHVGSSYDVQFYSRVKATPYLT